MRNTLFLTCALVWLLLAAAASARASELVYTPVNPSFGGSPLNGSWLLGSAAAQNTFKDNRRPGYAKQTATPLQKNAERFSRRFTHRVEREILDVLFGGTMRTHDLSGNGLYGGEATVYVEVNQYGDGNTSTIDILY
jgi:curli production assembly/transport component CsgF